jgi:hypothetical protein
MDGDLACQTDVTSDARDLYRARDGNDECEDCLWAAAGRGTALLLAPEQDETDTRWTAGSEIISLARAVLALGQRGQARAVAPADAGAADDATAGRPGRG